MIQREVADPIALALLKGEYVDGDVVVIDATSDGELVVQQEGAVASSVADLGELRDGSEQSASEQRAVANQPGMAGT